MKDAIVIVLSLILTFGSVHAQEDTNLFDYWQFYSDAENALYKYFCSVAFQQIDDREAIINNLNSLEDWSSRQDDVREKLVTIIGPFPEKTDLNILVTGIIQKDGFRVEKLIFESQPGYYVTAGLFIPDNINRRAPAILNPIGHSPLSFRRDIYQHTIINLVKKGFIVLAYDPVGQGERLQYYDENLGKSKFRSNIEHSYPGAQCFISGYSPAKYFIWDGIRGIDLLLSRPEVDPDRIGITGISGGGTLTAYISAIDDRILAAAPECYITNFRSLLKSEGPQDAEQNLVKFLQAGLDFPDFIEVRAPKPTLIMSTTRDFFSIQGARDTFKEARKAYTAYKALDNLKMTEADERHSFTKKNREVMYAFFQKHLNNPGDATDYEIEPIPIKELWSTETGQLATSLKGETIYSLNKKVVEKQVVLLDSLRLIGLEHLSQIPKTVAQITGFSYPGEFGSHVFSGRYVNKEYTLEKYLLDGSDAYTLPLALYIPGKINKNRAILLLHEEGKNYAANNDSLAKQLVANGYTVFLADLPGLGELGPGYFKGDSYFNDVSYNIWFAGVLTGKSIVGLRTEDILRMTHFIKTKFPNYNSITAISIGVLGSEMLHATVLDSNIQKVCLIKPFLSFADIAIAHEYNPSFILSSVPGAINQYDLPDLMAASFPKQMLILNPVQPGGASVTSYNTIKRIMRYPQNIYSSTAELLKLKLAAQTGSDSMVLKEVLSFVDQP